MNIDTNERVIHYKLDNKSSNPIIKNFTDFVFSVLDVENLEDAKAKMLIKENREKFDNIKKESDNILDKALLGIVKPIYFSIENIKKSF